MKLYGSITNRLEENKMYCDEIKVGTPATQYLWSDTHAYEVVEVINQKHIFVRRLNAKRVDKNYMSECQEYEYSSSNARPIELKKMKHGWKEVRHYTDSEGKDHTYTTEKWNISFGIAQEYYDYSF